MRKLRFHRQMAKLAATFERHRARQPDRSRELALRYRRAAEALDEQALPSWPRRIVHIAPDRSLGNHLTGTLNFRSAYSTKLMSRGYADAQAVIDRELTRGSGLR